MLSWVVLGASGASLGRLLEAIWGLLGVAVLLVVLQNAPTDDGAPVEDTAFALQQVLRLSHRPTHSRRRWLYSSRAASDHRVRRRARAGVRRDCFHRLCPPSCAAPDEPCHRTLHVLKCALHRLLQLLWHVGHEDVLRELSHGARLAAHVGRLARRPCNRVDWYMVSTGWTKRREQTVAPVGHENPPRSYTRKCPCHWSSPHQCMSIGWEVVAGWLRPP